MNLSEATLTILKNFSTINQSILFREGDVIRTISPQKSILAKAIISEEFDRDFAVYDLPRFLGVLSLFEQPQIETGDSSLKIMDDKRKLVYTYADPSSFTTPPSKDPNFPAAEVSFNLKNEDLSKVQKAGQVLQLPEIAIVGDGEHIFLKAQNSKDPTSDSYSSVVGETDKDFSVIFKNENMRLLPSDYDISISSRGISEFASDKLIYWIASETHSTFGK
jgi:hypothetical protein